MSGQATDAILASFDVSFDVDTGRCERFDEIICIGVAAGVASEVDGFLGRPEGVIDLDIENFGVVVGEMISEVVCEIVEILFFSLLKLRSETSLIIFFV